MQIMVFVDASRAYPQGCIGRDPSYYDYDSTTSLMTKEFPPSWLKVPVQSTADYKLIRRLGTGKFSDVFEAIPTMQTTMNPITVVVDNDKEEHVSFKTTKTVVIKCLKPVSERKIKREVFILQACSGLPNVVRFLAIVMHPPATNPNPYQSSSSSINEFATPYMPSLVMQHAGPNAQWLCHYQPNNPPLQNKNDYDHHHQNITDLSDYEIRYYLFQLLIALDGLHSMGIMHRDVKPRNVLVDRTKRTLVLIDLGLADFHRPGINYHVRVASRHYKAPELLTGYEQYDYAIDMWGVGCILAALLFQKRNEPVFRGQDNVDQLDKIVQVLGTRDLQRYLRKYQISVTPEIQQIIRRYSHPDEDSQSNHHPLRVDQWYSAFSNDDDDDLPFLPPKDGIDLLNQLLVYDPDERLSAREAMQHPFFDAVREAILAQQQSACNGSKSTYRNESIANQQKHTHDPDIL